MSDAGAIIVGQIITSGVLLLGTFVAWRIGRGQIRASSITSNRQVWIGELREEVAKIITAQAGFDALGKIYTPGNSEHERIKRELNDRMTLSYFKVRLLLGERSRDDDQLAETIHGFMNNTKQRDQVIEVATAILRDEQRRIEAGE
jgi:hypothetical protein